MTRETDATGHLGDLWSVRGRPPEGDRLDATEHVHMAFGFLYRAVLDVKRGAVMAFDTRRRIDFDIGHELFLLVLAVAVSHCFPTQVGADADRSAPEGHGAGGLSVGAEPIL